MPLKIGEEVGAMLIIAQENKNKLLRGNTMDRYIHIDTLIDYIDWDNDIEKWTLRREPEDIPMADVEVIRYGKWIPIWDYDESDGSKWVIGYQCSLCDGCVDWLNNDYNRCPHCGAKMSK